MVLRRRTSDRASREGEVRPKRKMGCGTKFTSFIIIWSPGQWRMTREHQQQQKINGTQPLFVFFFITVLEQTWTLHGMRCVSQPFYLVRIASLRGGWSGSTWECWEALFTSIDGWDVYHNRCLLTALNETVPPGSGLQITVTSNSSLVMVLRRFRCMSVCNSPRQLTVESVSLFLCVFFVCPSWTESKDPQSISRSLLAIRKITTSMGSKKVVENNIVKSMNDFFCL